MQTFGLNAKASQMRINRQAQEYLAQFAKIDKHPLDTKALKGSVKVLSSHNINGEMSRVLIESSLSKEPRWYDVSLNRDKTTVTFTPADDKSGSGVFTTPLQSGQLEFPYQQ